jgi:GTP-binding protein YchF
MSMKLGIVGLPNVGKSTLFNALTGAGAEVDNYPFTTVDPNVGIVPVPDTRLERLGELLKPERLTPARVEFIDIAGLVEGASRGEGLGNQFLAKIREVDGIVHVLRGFEEDVAHITGVVDPIADLEIVRTEMAIADLEVVNRRIEKLGGSIQRGDKSGIHEKEELEKIQGFLSGFDLAALREWVREGGFVSDEVPILSTKPVIYVVNVSESSASDPESATWVGEIVEKVGDEGSVIAMTVKLEGELSEMPPPEEEAFRNELGMTSRPMERLIREGTRLLELITFYTIKGEETRAWMIKKDTPVAEAAGKIHTDMERGFIKAEVTSCEDLFSLGSMPAVRDAGKLAVEGRGYPVRDGDVILIHFKN